MWQIRKQPRAEADEQELRERALEEHRLINAGDAGSFTQHDLHNELKVEPDQRLIAVAL